MSVLAAADRALRCRAHPKESSQVTSSLTYIQLSCIVDVRWRLCFPFHRPYKRPLATMPITL